MDVRISTASGMPRELATAAELRALRARHDLTGLEWTSEVVVEAFVVPHSHPVLTVNTRSTGLALLATYLHEHLHWWLADRPRTPDAVEATRAAWASVPTAADGGARDEMSTRLHLYVCFLEAEALRALSADDRSTHRGDGPYPWVYAQAHRQRALLARLCTRYELWPDRLRP